MVLVSVEKGRGRRLFVVLQALLCCAHTAELTKAKLVRGSYRARTRFETFEAVKKLICEVGMGFGGQELEKRYGHVPGFIQAVQGLSEGNLVPVRGGVLIRDAQGQLLGAVGVSGETSANDEICAVAGIESTGLTPDCGGPKP